MLGTSAVKARAKILNDGTSANISLLQCPPKVHFRSNLYAVPQKILT